MKCKLVIQELLQRTRQQNTKYCSPPNYPIILIAFLLFCAIIFLISGIIEIQPKMNIFYNVTLDKQKQAVEIRIDTSKQQLNKNIPIRIAYELQNFNQNIYSYINSYSLSQLSSSQQFSNFNLNSNCEYKPEEKINQPCGLLFRSNPNIILLKYQAFQGINDITHYLHLNNSLLINKNDITHNMLFGSYFKTKYQNYQQIIQWMRPSYQKVVKQIAVLQLVDSKILNTSNITIKLKFDAQSLNQDVFQYYNTNILIFQKYHYQKQHFSVILLFFGVFCTVFSLINISIGIKCRQSKYQKVLN